MIWQYELNNNTDLTVFGLVVHLFQLLTSFGDDVQVNKSRSLQRIQKKNGLIICPKYARILRLRLDILANKNGRRSVQTSQ